MLVFAIFSVATIWFNSSSNSLITWGVWFIFFVDFIVRFFKSTDKWNFIKKNPFLLIAIIPFDSVFQFARITRVVHLFRLKVITKHFTTPFINKLRNKRLTYIIPFSFIMVFLSVIPLYYFEPSIPSYKDAFLGSITSLIFFGSSDLNPTSFIGNTILILLTVFGVIMHGVLISYLFSYIANWSFVKSIVHKSISKEKDM